MTTETEPMIYEIHQQLWREARDEFDEVLVEDQATRFVASFSRPDRAEAMLARLGELQGPALTVTVRLDADHRCFYRIVARTVAEATAPAPLGDA